jgi:peptidoglycan/LPS O-acetylase OafA/YrhL
MAVCQWDPGFSRWFFINNLFDGRSAVTMFFVLSGFVLTLGHVSAEARPMVLIPFYGRRITRIWLPWFAFFLISLLARQFLFLPYPETVPPISAHHTSFWSNECSFPDILRQLVFQLHDSTKMLLPQDWSLGVELKASLLIPVFLWLARKKLPLLIFATIAVAWLKPTGGYYYASFGIGVVAAHAYAWRTRLPNGLLLACIGILLYQIRWFHHFTDLLPTFMAEREVWLLGSVACAMILLGTLKCGMLQRTLEHPLLAHLGRISYSLYLVQVIVLLCAAPWIVAALNYVGIVSEFWLQILLLFTITGICVVLADCGERWIEVPCIRLGKNLTCRLEKNRWVRRVSV